MDFNNKIREIKIKSAILALIIELPYVAYLAFSISLTGQIKTRKELVDYVISCPLADQSRPLGERLLRHENFVKEQPPQVFNIEEIKNLDEFKGKNEEHLRFLLNLTCIEPPKKLGRRKKNKEDKLTGRPLRKYQPSYDRTQEKMEEFMAICVDIFDSLSDIHKREVEKAFYKDLASLGILERPGNP